jgi:hypothetical protein
MKITHRKTVIVAIVLPAIVAVLSVPTYLLAKSVRFDTDAPPAAYPEASTLAEARAQDVEYLELFFELERSWNPASLAAARKLHEALQNDAANLSAAEFDLAVARIVAAADNAHTKVREYSRTPRYSRLPVRGHMFDDGYFLIRAHNDYENLLGMKLIAIDGKTVTDIQQGLRPYIGGNEATFDKYLPYLMESPELRHAAGLISSPNSLQLTLQNEEGEQSTVTLAAPYPPSNEQIARSNMLLEPKVYSQSQPEWQSVHPSDATLPLYLQAPFEQFQFVQDQVAGFSYLQFWTNNNVGDRSISDFCAESLATFRRNPTPNLVIDHRFNGGGNYHHTADCMEKLGRSVPQDGKLYVVVSGATFSAGIVSAATAVVAAGDRATIIGTSVGDRLVSWGEDNLLQLPNSEIEIKFSTGKHDLINGCGDWRECYWGNLFSDLRIDSLDPDVRVPLSYADYRAGRDPVMETITKTAAVP